MNHKNLREGGIRIMVINKYLQNYPKYCLTTLSLVMVFTFIFAGCSIKLIADYDEVIDKSATELQKKIESFLTKMERVAETEEGKYANYIVFYDETKVDLSAMLVRARAIPKNDLTVEAIGEILQVIKKIEIMHKEGLKKSEIKPLREAIITQFTWILKFELAKKRGEKSSEKK
jgi:hypothetical protein